MTHFIGQKRPVAVYRLSQPGNGANWRLWDGPPDSVPHGDVADVFTGPTDPVTGFPSHPNAPTSTGVDDWNVSTTGATGGVSNGADQFEVWGWIDTSSLGPVLLRDVNGNTGERGEVWIGECCGTPTRRPGFQEGSDTVGGATGLLDPTQVGAGVHFVYLRLSDFSAFAGVTLQYTTDLAGVGGWTNFPTALSYVAKPIVECVQVDGCDPIPDGWSVCPPELCAPVHGPDIDGPAGSLIVPASTVPLANQDWDTGGNGRVGDIGSSLEYARADHRHPIDALTVPPWPGVSLSLSAATSVVFNGIISSKSTSEIVSYNYRLDVQHGADNGWNSFVVNGIAGYRPADVTPVGLYHVSGQWKTGGQSIPVPSMSDQVCHYFFGRVYFRTPSRDQSVRTIAFFRVDYWRNP